MKEQLVIEKMIYADIPDFQYVELLNGDFLVNIFINYPKMRPLYLNQIVNYCMNYTAKPELMKKLLIKGLFTCPTLIQRLHVKGVYSITDIMEEIMNCKKYYLFLFFKSSIGHFDYSSILYNEEEDEDEYSKYHYRSDLDLLIEYGFVPSSIEYCLKYDDYKNLKELLNDFPDKFECEWNPFEWSNIPNCLELTSFSASYGSINCFKILLLLGYSLSASICQCIVNGGIIGFVNDYISKSNKDDLFQIASKTCRLSILSFLLEKSVDINTKYENQFTNLHNASRDGNLIVVHFFVSNMAHINSKTSKTEIFVLIGPLFILLQIMGI